MQKLYLLNSLINLIKVAIFSRILILSVQEHKERKKGAPIHVVVHHSAYNLFYFFIV